MKLTVSIKKYVVALLIPFLLAPQITQAQVVLDREQLLQTVQQLLVQIQQLQDLLDQRVASQIDPLDDFEGEIVYRYRISGELHLPATAPLEHARYVAQLYSVLPEKYRDYIDQFVIFDNYGDDTAAFVLVESDGVNTQWVYGLNIDELGEDPSSEGSLELMIHEFAHVFSLDQVMSAQELTDDCHEYFDDEGCFPPGSYLESFADEFWDIEILDELVEATESQNPSLELERLYDRRHSEFVTDYAATSPDEDFAETFAWYVLGLEAKEGTVAQEKIDFMDSQSSIRSYKAHINSQI